VKKILILSLISLTITSSIFANDRGPGPIPPPPQPPQRPGDAAVALGICLNDLSRSRNELNECRRSSVDPREVEQLRRDNQRLLQENSNLQAENADLRRQIEQSKPPRQRQFFSYAGCISSNGVTDTRYIGSGIGMLPIEAESKATSSTQAEFKCNYGVKVVKTEEIVFQTPNNFCSAACVSSAGIADARYSAGEKGRNITEASFGAMKKTQEAFKCNLRCANCKLPIGPGSKINATRE
jgi:hypothetical protein